MARSPLRRPFPLITATSGNADNVLMRGAYGAPIRLGSREFAVPGRASLWASVDRARPGKTATRDAAQSRLHAGAQRCSHGPRARLRARASPGKPAHDGIGRVSGAGGLFVLGWDCPLIARSSQLLRTARGRRADERSTAGTRGRRDSRPLMRRLQPPARLEILQKRRDRPDHLALTGTRLERTVGPGKARAVRR